MTVVEIVDTTANAVVVTTPTSYVVTIASSLSTGDVSGPASSTDNAIVRFDGLTGKIIQDSVVTVDDTTGVIKGCTEVWFDSSGDYKLVKNGTKFEIWVQGIKVQSWG